MTTKFEAPDWKGKTVAVLAGGPSMSAELAESLRAHTTIAINYVVCNIAPWADAVLALDGVMSFWDGIKDYVGTKMCGVPSDDIDAMFIGSMYETLILSPNHTIDLRNSGLAAIRIAARCGASKILLAGFDPHTGAHAVGYPIDPITVSDEPYPHLAKCLELVIANVRASGVIVEFVEPLPVAPTRSARKLFT